MSMRFTNKKRTLCEVLREIHDEHSGKNKHDALIRAKIAESIQMAKRMTKKLYEYNKEYDADWWKENPNYEKSLKKRIGIE